MSDQKKFYRDLKREIKKDGNRQRRHYLKRALQDHPSEAHWDEFDYGRSSSQWLNGIDEESNGWQDYDHDDEGGCDLPPGSEVNDGSGDRVQEG